MKKTASKEGTGTSVVMQGSIVESITGSGTVEPIEQREIVPLVNGKITESPFEEGDEVMENDVLYRFEMTAAENAIKTAQNNVEKAQTNLSNRSNSIDKAQENINRLTVRATASGKVSDLSVNVGEEVSGKLCVITNYKEQTATLPVSVSYINSIKIGDSANVAIDKYMINTTGTVIRKYSAPETLSGGAVVYNVEIRLSDKYVVEENVNVTAVIKTETGDISSASYGTVEYAAPVTVNAEQKGRVSKLNVKNGDWIDKGDVIAVLTNSDLNDELKTARQNYNDALMSLSEAERSMEDKQEAAEDYIVTAPINGTVLTKSYTVGDTVGGQNATTMMVVADMSKMKFTISVDELDISKIQIGQSVAVSADALEGESITGTITSLSKLGTASNGVTTYPVEVTIDEPGELMPGMNVSAEIIVAQADNCLYLPVGAVEYFGGKYYVTVVGEAENMPTAPPRREMSIQGNGENTDKENSNQLSPQENGIPRPNDKKQSLEGMSVPENSQRPEKTKPNDSEKSSQQKNTETDKKQSEFDNKSFHDTKPENMKQMSASEIKIKLSGKEERVEVEVGISNDEYYEIKSGLTLGQVVKNTSQQSGNGSTVGMLPGGMGGMPMGGGMPGGMPGGMSGGAPGGMGGRR